MELRCDLLLLLVGYLAFQVHLAKLLQNNLLVVHVSELVVYLRKFVVGLALVPYLGHRVSVHNHAGAFLLLVQVDSRIDIHRS